MELDVEWTKDGVPIVLHDDSLDRTTDASGLVRNLNYAELKSVDAAAKHPRRQEFGFQKIPRLDEAVDLLLSKGLRMILDIKDHSTAVVPDLVQLFRERPGLEDQAAVASFYPTVPYALRAANPKIIVGHTWRPNFYAFQDTEGRRPRFPDSFLYHSLAELADLLNILGTHYVYPLLSGASLCLTQERSISMAYVDWWAERGVAVVSWTSNDGFRECLLRHFRVPFLTDRLSDFRSQLNAHRKDEESSSLHQPNAL